jgi:CubicO group peptidase (beta-lactamase class C family)
MRTVFTLSAALLAASACATADPTPKGLWLGEVKADAGAPITIEVAISDGQVLANEGEGKLSSDTLSIVYESGAIFKGHFEGDNAPISGFYVQPGNQIGGQRLSHSVRLIGKSDGSWIGTAKPLARQFSVFMDILQEQDGHLTATLLNPERNITGPERRYDLVPDVELSTYSLQASGGQSNFASATIDHENRVMRMNFGPLEDFELRWITDQDPLAVGFRGSANMEGLTKPAPKADWPTGSVEEAGFRKIELARLVSDLRSVDGHDEHPNLVHSLLVARGGKLVVEEYFRGHDADTPHDVRSAGKTFASVLVGALIQDGMPLVHDTPINQFISVPNEPTNTPVTIGNLLTHQSGLDCYDGDESSAGNENIMWQQSDKPNLWEFIAELDFVATPGERYAYCSGGINLVGAALAGASDESVLSLLQTRLFEPLAFENAYWNVMPDGNAYLGGGAQLRTRDLLKIGQLYLNGGKWRGEQLVDEAWVEASIEPTVNITPATTGLDETSFNRFYFGGADGFAWHLHSITVDERSFETFEASGNGGQLVVVVPELDLVVGMTGGNYGQGHIWGQWRQKIIGDRIVAALLHD